MRRMHVTLPDDIVAAVDSVARGRGVSRNALMVRAIEEFCQRVDSEATSKATADPNTNTAPRRFPTRPSPLAAPLTLVVDAGETCVGDECALPGATQIPVSPKPADD